MLKVENLSTSYKLIDGDVHVLNDLNFEIHDNEIFGIAGESGCGKTTVGKLIMQLIKPDSGEIVIDGKHVGSLSRKELHEARQGFQMVFQDPYGSLDPTKSILSVLAEPIKEYNLLPKEKIYDRACELIKQVGLNEYDLQKYPHEFSGGQRQRIVVARALAMQPKIIVCDEPVSALDVSVQAQILNLLKRLQHELGVSFLFIAHGMAVVKHISDSIMVMYLGRCVELAPSDELFANPLHPYTKALLAAIPEPDLERSRSKKLEVIRGEVSSPIDPKPSCRFAARCEYCKSCCTESNPEFVEVSPGHFVSCFLVNDR